jgi:hypothetical protein
MIAADHFNIHRGGVLRGTVAGNVHTFDDTPVSPGSYSYVVTAVNGVGSTVATPATIPVTVVDVPGAFVVSLDSFTPTSVTLDWTASANMVSTDEYEIFRDASSVGTVAGNILTFDDTTIPGAGSYDYQVVATNPAGSTTATPDPLTVVVVTGTNWNPADAGAGVTLSNSDLTADGVLSNSFNVVRAVAHHTTGKYYYESLIDAQQAATSFPKIGIGEATIAYNNLLGYGATGKFSTMQAGSLGFCYRNGAYKAQGVTFLVGDRVGIAVDLTAGKIWFAKNNVWILSGDPAAGTNETWTLTTGIDYYPICNVQNPSLGTTLTSAFAAGTFTFTPPTGFDPW